MAGTMSLEKVGVWKSLNNIDRINPQFCQGRPRGMGVHWGHCAQNKFFACIGAPGTNKWDLTSQIHRCTAQREFTLNRTMYRNSCLDDTNRKIIYPMVTYRIAKASIQKVPWEQNHTVHTSFIFRWYFGTTACLISSKLTSS